MDFKKPSKTSPERHWIYWSGLALIVLGAGVSTFATFSLLFYLIPFWIFLLGVILVWMSQKTAKVKLMWTLFPIGIFITFQLVWRWVDTAPPETFLIDADYRGKVHVHFNKPCGEMPEKEDGRRVYRISNTGVLLSQFGDKQGYIDQEYYLIDSRGRRKKLPKLDVRNYNEQWTTEKNPKEPSRDILGVFHWGRVYNDGTLEFYICTYRQLEAYSNFRYQKKYDSLESKIISSCR